MVVITNEMKNSVNNDAVEFLVELCPVEQGILPYRVNTYERSPESLLPSQ